jgi:hypothetical protein
MSKAAAKASEGQNLTQRGCTEPRTAAVEGFKVPEQEPGIISSENMLKSQNGPLFVRVGRV